MSTRAFAPASDRATRPHTGLTEAECFAIARAAADLPGAWWVQHDEDDQGHVGIGLVPDDGGTGDGAPDENALAFLLRREGGLLRLAHGQGEFYADLGAYADVDAIMDAVRRALQTAAAVTLCIRSWRPAPAGSRALREPEAAAMHLADWADAARRSGRTLRADKLLRLAWEAYDRPRQSAARR